MGCELILRHEASSSYLIAGDTGTSTMTITGLHVDPHVRGTGVATTLLAVCAAHCVAHAVDVIELDDMSDRFGMTRNVYTRAGFLYTVAGHPEMYASPETVVACTRPFVASHVVVRVSVEKQGTGV